MYRSDTLPNTLVELGQYTLSTFKTAPHQPKEITDPIPECEKIFEKHVAKDAEADRTAWMKLKRKLNILLHGVDDEAAFERFVAHFPDIIHDDRLLGEFNATLCCANGRIRGYILISSHHILFMGVEDQSLKVITPFTEVESYNVMAPTTIQTDEHFAAQGKVQVMRPKDANDAARCNTSGGQEIFQIFLRSKQLLILIDVDHFGDCVNIFDHAWRQCGTRHIEEIPQQPTSTSAPICECPCSDCTSAACAKCTTGKCAFKSVNAETDRRPAATEDVTREAHLLSQTA